MSIVAGGLQAASLTVVDTGLLLSLFLFLFLFFILPQEKPYNNL
jgi:hypothetical protein